MEIEVELPHKTNSPLPTVFKSDEFPALRRLEDHPLKEWIRSHPGAAKLEIAASSYDLSRYQVYNWLEAAVERGEIICEANKYYASILHLEKSQPESAQLGNAQLEIKIQLDNRTQLDCSSNPAMITN